MSCMEAWRGQAKKIDVPEEKIKTFKDKIAYFKSIGIPLDDIDYEDETYYSEHIFEINDEWYRVIDANEFHHEDEIAIAKKEENGEISFTLQFYNGGTFFGEMFEKAIKNMGEKY